MLPHEIREVVLKRSWRIRRAATFMADHRIGRPSIRDSGNSLHLLSIWQKSLRVSVPRVERQTSCIVHAVNDSRRGMSFAFSPDEMRSKEQSRCLKRPPVKSESCRR